MATDAPIVDAVRISLGHPLGATGACMCIGSRQAIAAVVEQV